MKIAIYGGSFNPPHLGHERVAKAAASDLDLDKIIIIPDNIPPHKAISSNAPSANTRFEMCKIAFKDVKNAEISDIEIKRGGKSYTYDTLCEIKEIYPDAELFLIMGTDMMDSFNTWYRPDDIRKMCTLYVAPRLEGSESSTAARKQIKESGCSPMLSDAVNKYIKDNNLYK